MQVTGLVPARFLTIVAHLVIVIVIFWSREENILMCLPDSHSQAQYDGKDYQMVVALSVTLGMFLIELMGFMGGLTMFATFHSLLSTVTHAGAAVALSYFLFDAWPCDWYWYVFGFCSAFPAFIEVMAGLHVLCFK
ncbi:hypothetical protein ACOMHN_020618 [Nucella lapillus]